MSFQISLAGSSRLILSLALCLMSISLQAITHSEKDQVAGNFRSAADAQDLTGPTKVIFKKLDTLELHLKLYYPPAGEVQKEYPAIIFFFGGGWNEGSWNQFIPHARYFAQRGMIGIVAEYRVRSRNGTTPFDAVMDAKSAIRYLRSQAKALRIDPVQIVASGGSAGGHLAAATGTLDGLEHPDEDLSVSSRPDALVLFNPVFDNGPDGYGYERIGDRYPEISPLHNIRPGTPPAIVFLGTQDRLIPVETAREYQKKMEEAGSRCVLKLYEGQKHGFFNFRNPSHFDMTVSEADRFLADQGFLEPPGPGDLKVPSEIMLRETVEAEKSRVIKLAGQYWDELPLSVTAYTCERSAGGAHDFYSEGDYWWPDPNDPGGPYIRKDGLSNPDNFSRHRLAMIRMSRIVGTMASAYLVTGEESYVRKAMDHLRVWFITPQTRMNPHMRYAQAIQGRYTGRGIGIIDGIHLAELALAIKKMESSPAVTGEELYALKEWFREFLQWISTHEYGRAEMVHPNNHGTCWALQAAAYAWLTDTHEMLDFCAARYRDTLLPEQMAEDGSFPRELERTKPYGYSLFNLDAMASLVQVLSLAGTDLWKYETPDGRSISRGMAFLYPYIDGKAHWPYPADVLYFEEWPVRQAFLVFGGLETRRPEYLESWFRLESDPEQQEVIRNMIVKHPLLWLNIHDDPASNIGPWQALKENLEGRLLSRKWAGGFTGIYVGMHGSSNGKPAKNHVEFDWFEYVGENGF